MKLRSPAGLGFLFATLAWAQSAPPDAARFGAVSGVVTDGKTGEPVRKATVILRDVSQPPDASAGFAAQAKGVGTVSDAGGKFALEQLDPGTYTVTAERDGYVLARESKRQLVTVRAGEAATDLKIRLLRTGTISGRVFDTDGDPVRNATVQAMPLGRSRLTHAWASTNDRGEYRAFNLTPGTYRLSAAYAFQNASTIGPGVRMQAARGSASALTSYPTLYYPGTLDQRQATAVTVEPGDDLPGFDFHLKREHAVAVRGRVTGLSSPSAPSIAAVFLGLLGREGGQTRETVIENEDGKFELTNILPGTYRLSATRFSVGADGSSEANQLTAQRTIVVGDADLEGIQISLGAPQKVTGRVELPEGRKLPPTLAVLLQPREEGDSQSGGMALVETDGKFAFNSVRTGEFSVQLGSRGDSGDLYVSSIRHGDRDALAEGVSVGADPAAPLLITLKAAGGTLVCQVNDEEGKPMYDAAVLLVPDPPKEQQFALQGTCQTDLRGECRISGIAPGAYHAYPLLAENGGLDRRDPEALKPFEKYGKPMKFAEGQKQTVELTGAPVE